MKKYFSIKEIAINAIIAALYVVLSLISGPLAFVGGSLQFRLSELLNLLVFFNPVYTLGVTLGCLITNIISLYGWPDLVVGTLATLISCLLIWAESKFVKNLLLASLIPCVINATIVPIVIFLYDMSVNLSSFYWISFMWVGLGELIVCTLIGYPLVLLISKKYKNFYSLINATQNIGFKW
jgi:uncharacterized membrane protein